MFIFASLANAHSVHVHVYVVHNLSGPFEQLAVSSLFANISVFPNNESIVLHNHNTMLTVRKFNITIVLIQYCYLIYGPYSNL